MPKGDRLILKADPEDGTTPIANLLLEAVAMAKLSGLQKGAILYLWRKTYGWVAEDGRRVQECQIGLKEWCLALNSTKSSVSTALTDLDNKNVITRRSDHWQVYNYKINTDIKTWNSGCINIEQLSKSVLLPKTAQYDIPDSTEPGNSCDEPYRTVTQIRTEQLPKTVLPSILKETLKKDKERNTQKQVYGEFKNVKLTDKEYGKLVERYSEKQVVVMIEALSGHKKSKGKRYKDDYATILNWFRRDEKDGRTRTASNRPRAIPEKYTTPEEFNAAGWPQNE